MQIGTSGQQKRLTSITVQPTRDPTSGKLVAAVAAMGVPIFPGGGQWSFVRTRRDDQANQPQPVDLAKGVPLVKLGQHDNPDLGSLVTPYLFRDPQDLLDGTPATVYNIVHANPEIPFAQEAPNGFEAAKVWVADSVALGKSASIFPSLDDYLPVKTGDTTQLLEIVQGGGYKFKPKRLFRDHRIPHLESSECERIVKNDASVQTVAQSIQDGTKLKDAGEQLVKDVLDAKTTLSVDIDTLTNISKIDVTNLHMVTRSLILVMAGPLACVGRACGLRYFFTCFSRSYLRSLLTHAPRCTNPAQANGCLNLLSLTFKTATCNAILSFRFLAALPVSPSSSPNNISPFARTNSA